MRPEPPAELVQLLDRLDLATPVQVRSVAGRVRRLARDLPLFESVWVDALAQARIVTPFQAAEINAGRGAALRIGSLILCQKLISNGLGEWFIARQGGQNQLLRLARFPLADQPPDTIAEELEQLIRDLRQLDLPLLAPAELGGVGEGYAWLAGRHIEGVTAADWLARHGRMPPEAVLEIARQMMTVLEAIEARGRVHGDLSARQLILRRGGGIGLVLPGWRPIVRPVEGYSRADLPPEAFDGLAPERVHSGSPPTAASEAFALACLWWHLLAGRPPLSGGDALSKLRAAHAAKIVDVRQWAPQTPWPLAEAICRCLKIDSRQRPESMAELAEMLGASTHPGKRVFARCLERTSRPITTRRRRPPVTAGARSRLATLCLGIGGIVLAALLWMSRGAASDLPLTSIAASSPVDTPVAVEAVPIDPPNDQHDLVLGTDQPLRLGDLTLRPGQTVRGQPGERPKVLVPADGLRIDCEDIIFENIDFVSDTRLTDLRGNGLIQLRAERATFRGCSFQASAEAPADASAILWLEPPKAPRQSQLSTGTLQFVDCAFRSLRAIVDCRTPSALRIELQYCLHLGPGPVLKRPRMPSADAPCIVALKNCTVREASGVFESMYASGQTSCGEITLHAVDCAFTLTPGHGLINLSGDGDPLPLLRRVQWTGQGSLLAGEAPMAVWRGAGDRWHPLPEESTNVQGLVRSTVEFAGEATASVAASRLVHWQAPLRSPDPPGLGDRTLFLPDLE